MVSKELDDVLKVLDEDNPYACYLANSTISRVTNWVDTGSYVLNGIISGKLKDGGIPDGRLTVLYGESQTMKSYFVQKILANAQKQGKIPVIFDTENAIDPEGAERLGLDTSKVKYIPTFNIEKCRNDIYKFLTAVKQKGLCGKFIIAVDSLGNLESQLEQNRMEKESASADMGSRAKAIGSLLRTLTQLCALTQTPAIVTNHVYDDPSAMHPTLVKTMPGGKKTIYLPSVSVQLMRKPVKEDVVKSDDTKLAALQKSYVGIILRALTAKNRFIKQYLEGEIFLSFDKGVDKYYGLLDLAVGLGVIEQTGSTYQFNGEKLGYASRFEKNYDWWENTIIPLMQKQMDIQWAYSNTLDETNNKLEKEAEIDDSSSVTIINPTKDATTINSGTVKGV